MKERVSPALVFVLASALFGGCVSGAPWSKWVGKSYEQLAQKPPKTYDGGPLPETPWFLLDQEIRNSKAYFLEALRVSGFQKNVLPSESWIPKYYRGRLGVNEASVLVIDGSEDRGGYMARAGAGVEAHVVQHYLDYLGVGESYLFLSPYVWDPPLTLNSKAAQRLWRWLHHSPQSRWVQTWDRVLDQALLQNKKTLNLILGFGSHGEGILLEALSRRGLQCEPFKLRLFDCRWPGLEARVLVVVVPPIPVRLLRHGVRDLSVDPAKLFNLEEEFERVTEELRERRRRDPKFFSTQFGVRPIPAEKFLFSATSIPERDLGFGSPKAMRLGFQSPLWDSRESVFTLGSLNTCPNSFMRNSAGKCEALGDDLPPRKLKVTYPWPNPGLLPESQEKKMSYDIGPSYFGSYFITPHPFAPWPGIGTLGIDVHPSLSPQAFYRGRIVGARVIIIADQESQVDQFTQRALTGSGGQRLQAFISKLGVGDRYLILRSIPFDSSGLSPAQIQGLLLNPAFIRAQDTLLSLLFRAADAEVVLTLGPWARQIMAGQSPGVPVLRLESLDSPYLVWQWRRVLDELKARSLLSISSTSYFGESLEIPASDLPYGTPQWLWKGQVLAARGKIPGEGGLVWSPDHYGAKPSRPLGSTEPSLVSKLTPAEIRAMRQGQ